MQEPAQRGADTKRLANSYRVGMAGATDSHPPTPPCLQRDLTRIFVDPVSSSLSVMESMMVMYFFTLAWLSFSCPASVRVSKGQ